LLWIGKRERLPYNFFAFIEEKGRVFTTIWKIGAGRWKLAVTGGEAKQSLSVIRHGLPAVLGRIRVAAATGSVIC
jgi:hypothetical protein